MTPSAQSALRHPFPYLVALAAFTLVAVVGGLSFWDRLGDRHQCPDAALSEVVSRDAPLVLAACEAEGEFLGDLKAALAERGIDRDRLWRTNEASDTADALEAWRSGRLISYPPGPEWSVPVDPDWSEDPYHNISWQSRYHSLAWLTALARGYREGDQALGQEVARYVLDWIADNPTEDPPSPRSWYDHSVAWRTDALVSMWDVLVDVLSEAELRIVLGSLHLHGSTLHGHLSEERFVGHNHNLFHALSLFNLASHLPELSDAGSWRNDSLQRVRELLTEMVNVEDGVSTEQASNYHYLAVSLFSRAEAYLALWNESLGESARGLLRRTSMFAALLPDPAGTLPAIGDTQFGASARARLNSLALLRERGLTTPEADYLLSRGEQGRRPPDAVFFDGEGYAIFRPSYGEIGRWEDDVHVVVDMGPDRRVHGHDDAMNVLLSAYGEQLLIDSGGPYEYGVPERRRFVVAQAHNTVVADGRGYLRGDVLIERKADNEQYSLIAGSHDKLRGAHHRRTVMLIKHSLLVVIDELTSTDEEAHDFDLLYHLPPDADIVPASSGATVRVREAAMALAVAAGREIAVAVREGEEDPLFGWVTRGLSQREPAPVLTFSQRGDTAWFVTVAHLAAEEGVSLPDVHVEVDGGSYAIDVRSGHRQWVIEVPSRGEPSVVTR